MKNNQNRRKQNITIQNKIRTDKNNRKLSDDVLIDFL